MQYLFLTAWVEGSDSASGEMTGVNDQADLLVQYWLNNEHIFAVVIIANSIEVAEVYGRAQAWSSNYTAHDTVSNVVELADNYPCASVLVIKAHN